MKKASIFFVILFVLAMAGCAAHKITPQGQAVDIDYEKPDGDCDELGDVIGSQGNWFTGGYTSNKNLIEGSTNDMRNQAATMGGTDIWLHQQNTNTGAYSNTVNAIAIGTVYRCK